MTTRTTDRISFRWPVLITALALGLFARAGWTSGETITQSIGTMEPGQSVTIVFDATIDNPQTPINNSQVCNQGLVSSANHADVQPTTRPGRSGGFDLYRGGRPGRRHDRHRQGYGSGCGAGLRLHHHRRSDPGGLQSDDDADATPPTPRPITTWWPAATPSPRQPWPATPRR